MLRRGFTLIELLVVVAILAVLASLLFPVFASARASARQAVCLSNQRQIGLALCMYTADWDDHYMQNGYFAHAVVMNPVTEQHFSWADVIWPYTHSTQVFDCPGGLTKWKRFKRFPYTYTLNHVYTGYASLGGIFGGSGTNERGPCSTAEIQLPTRTVFIGDGDFYQAANFPAGDPVQLNTNPPRFQCAQGAFLARHHDGCVVTLLDGHSKWMTIPELGRKSGAVYVHFAKTDGE
jgi:prepilin-type N-terminal cleavage/methylation domain-containing protein